MLPRSATILSSIIVNLAQHYVSPQRSAMNQMIWFHKHVHAIASRALLNCNRSQPIRKRIAIHHVISQTFVPKSGFGVVAVMPSHQKSVSKMLWRPSGTDLPNRPVFRVSTPSDTSPPLTIASASAAAVPYEVPPISQPSNDSRRLYGPIQTSNAAITLSAFNAKSHPRSYNNAMLSHQSPDVKMFHSERKRLRTHSKTASPIPAFSSTVPSQEVSTEERNATRLNTSSNAILTRASPVSCTIDVPILYNNVPCPISFVVHKILEFLQEKKQMLTLTEVENHFKKKGYVGLHIKTNKELFQALQTNERILYDIARKKLAFVNPYERVVSSEALLASVCYDGGLTGLRVTDDLLTAHVSVKDWIHGLLVSRRIRCIRPNNSHLRGKFKCAFASSERTCGLYSRKKCKACFENLKGLLLYPLGDDEFESARLCIDPDVKALWDSSKDCCENGVWESRFRRCTFDYELRDAKIEIPAMETILKDYNIDMPAPKWQHETPREKRGKAAGMGRFSTKMRRIQNTHLFTAEELRGEIQQQQLSSWGSAINF
ncbi:hypothetical protein IE077_004592 [Cardiosporidium cionae]|uniref:TFIIE beta domain-containing protein n=1 Tax=Cardiosporidium cionae TaxID=476202 RepID=A0ABQ7J7E3_9APIC|nr:hypothetical protein IE077_004592 [Cardiosporidium cionae]|eukprot:KAF8819869.1 hypothetical protein IE077_004592 [Cardiosporidium cionae]